MATGIARGARDRGKRVAFGDESIRKIRWDQHSEVVFRFNPNIAPPGSERSRDMEWVRYFKGGKGTRVYNEQIGDRWRWRPDRWKAKPGEIYLTDAELEVGRKGGEGFILIEPNVPHWKSVAPNKQWPVNRFDDLATEFINAGYRVVQFGHKDSKHRLRQGEYVPVSDFRVALATLMHARLAVLPEGGMHHGAAARVVSVRTGRIMREFVPAVVLFGGFIPPSVTGYDFHANLTGGAEACGNFKRCQHCVDAMNAISVDDALKAADGLLNG